MKSINYSKLWDSSYSELLTEFSLIGWNQGPVIYGIHNIVLDKWYIGTSKNIAQRFYSGSLYSHTKKAKDNSGYFITPDNYSEFEVLILLETDYESTQLLESEYIKKFSNTYNGNSTGKSGGDTVSGSRKIYNPITNELRHWWPGEDLPDGFILGRGYDSPGPKGLVHYYDPITLSTITCKEGEQPDNYIKGQGWSSTTGTTWLYSCKLKIKVMKKLTDNYLSITDDWRKGAPRGDFWLDPDSYNKPILNLPLTDH